MSALRSGVICAAALFHHGFNSGVLDAIGFAGRGARSFDSIADYIRGALLTESSRQSLRHLTFALRNTLWNNPNARPLVRSPRQADAEFNRIRIDTYIGMGLSNFVALCIIITIAAALNAKG